MYLNLKLGASPIQEEQVVEAMALMEMMAGIKAKVAHTVRNNARRYRSLTPGQMVNVLAKDLPDDVQRSLAGDMSKEPGFSDIRTLLTPSGQLFLYSLHHLSPKDAETKGRLEDVKQVLAEKIRRNSRVTTTLTTLRALYDLWPELQTAQVCALLNEMQAQPAYRDLKTISSLSGELFLYSELHMTGNYAALLVKAAMNDACATIVSTVREESRIYPRPTKISVFSSHAYGIQAASLQPCIVKILNNPLYFDIRKMVHPDTEAVYLYSTQHLTEEQASTMMRWLEEGSAPEALGHHLR